MKRCSSHRASSTSCTLRRSVRSGPRNRFLASCWVMVEPPWTTRPCQMFTASGAGEPDQVDAEVGVEARILGRDEGVRHVGRQLLDGDGPAGGLAEAGERRAVGGEQGHRMAPLERRDIADGRQLIGIPGDQRADRQHAPDRGHQPPLEQHAQHAAAAGLRGTGRLARCLAGFLGTRLAGGFAGHGSGASAGDARGRARPMAPL